MATIIQPYNAWREQLAANLLGPIVGNILQRSQEANQNRKMNALMGKVNEDITALGSKNQGQQNLLTGEPMPEGYNNDGWAKAFHTSFTPITQYDLGTNLLTGQPVKPYTPTMQDYMNAINSNLATPRFGMLNRDNVMKAFEPIMTENRNQQVVNALRDATDETGRLHALQEGAIGGANVPVSVLNSAYDLLKFNNLSASDVANNAFRDKEFAENKRRYEKDFDENQRRFDMGFTNDNYWRGVAQENNIRDFGENQRRFDTEINRPELITNDDGGSVNYYTRNPITGEITPEESMPKDPLYNPNFFTRSEFNFILAEQGKNEEAIIKISEEIEKVKTRYNEALAMYGEDDDVTEAALANLQALTQQKNEIIQRGIRTQKKIDDMRKAAGVSNGMLPPVPEQYRPNGNVNLLTGQPISPDMGTSIASPDIAPQPNLLSSDENSLLTLPTSAPQTQRQVQPQETKNQSRVVEENGKKYLEFNIPDELFYDESRDKNIPSENIGTSENLIKWLSANVDPNDPKLSANNLVKYLFKKNFRIRK